MSGRTLNLLFIFACFFAGVYIFISGHAPIAILCIIAAGIGAWIYYSRYSVLTALYLYSANKKDKAKKAIERIKKPEVLSRNEKGNYYWLNGVLYAEDRKFDEAEKSLLKAREFLTKGSNAEFMVCISLAQIYVEIKEWEKAKQYIGESNKFPQAKRNAGLIDELLKKTEENEKQ